MTDLHFSVDPARCLKCRLCVKVCSSGTLIAGPDGTPAVSRQNGGKFCKKCQHCLAVCPTGALSIFGRKADDCPPKGELASVAELQNLIQFRRSCRHYLPRGVEPEVIQKLLAVVPYVPTGLNRHQLCVSVISDAVVMQEIREKTLKGLIAKIEAGDPSPLVQAIRGRYEALKAGDDPVFHGAPHVIVLSVPKEAPGVDYDPVIAGSYLELFANAQGLGTCWCGFVLTAMEILPELRERMKIPAGNLARAALLFGYPEVPFQRATLPEPVPINVVE